MQRTKATRRPIWHAPCFIADLSPVGAGSGISANPLADNGSMSVARACMAVAGIRWPLRQTVRRGVDRLPRLGAAAAWVGSATASSQRCDTPTLSLRASMCVNHTRRLLAELQAG